jgi:hypothetical protein
MKTFQFPNNEWPGLVVVMRDEVQSVTRSGRAD